VPSRFELENKGFAELTKNWRVTVTYARFTMFDNLGNCFFDTVVINYTKTKGDKRMKKVVALILVLMSVVCVILSGSAEEIDLAELSDYEFVALYRRMNEELVNRKLVKTAHLESGKYEGGIDIPEGEYQLVVDNTNGKSSVSTSFMATHPYLMQTFMGSVAPGKIYRTYINITEHSKLSIGCDFDLLIKPRGMITFE
jgi:hypothetical protein